MRKFDVVVIGGGPAGMAAAVSARKNGIENIIIFERDQVLGGILNQCIHNGFGLHTFKEELTGPEYAERYFDMVKELEIPYETGTMVMDISKDKIVTILSPERGVEQVKAEAVILAMGCRERPRGALGIAGFRPQGIYTAGTAQRLINIDGVMVGKEVVILGSGDIGLIMARRMTLEGAHVAAVFELMPYSNGLNRNIVQCLEDYDIPLYLSHTIVDIKGKEKLEGVVVAEVKDGKPVKGTEVLYPCDTLLLSCGLIPENELSRNCGIGINPLTNGPKVDDRLETDIDGVFACGNVLHVHDLVDYVSAEASVAGESAAEYVKLKKLNMNTDLGSESNSELNTESNSDLSSESNLSSDFNSDLSSDSNSTSSGAQLAFVPGNGVRYTVPNTFNIRTEADIHIKFRVTGVYKNASIVIKSGEKELLRRKTRVLIPSEMQDVLLKNEKLKLADGDVNVYIEE